MKRQLRPYTVETKSSRPRPANASASRPAPIAVDPFPEALPVRDVHEDVGQGTRDETSTKSKALLEAERIFKGLMTFPWAEPSTALTQSPLLCDKEVSATRVSIPAASADLLEARSPEAEERRPRVLPDLREQARPPELPGLALKVKRASAGTRKPRVKRSSGLEAAKGTVTVNPAPVPALGGRPAKGPARSVSQASHVRASPRPVSTTVQPEPSSMR
jgi:hypothetical protein